jgi:hypothetical protein
VVHASLDAVEMLQIYLSQAASGFQDHRCPSDCTFGVKIAGKVSENGGLLKGFSGRHYKIKTKPSAHTVYKKYKFNITGRPSKNYLSRENPCKFPS